MRRNAVEEEEGLLLKGTAPKDSYNLAYTSYYILGVASLLPWSAFISAVDYFAYLYPDARVDRIFTLVYLIFCLFVLISIIKWARKASSFTLINVGLVLFLVSLSTVPFVDLVYVKGRVGTYSGYYVTVALVALSGVANALVQSSSMGAAGELPHRYMQSTVAGPAASGVLVSLLRIITKAIYPQDAHGLRSSANLYFSITIVVIVASIICHNMADKLPVIQYYKHLKLKALSEERILRGPLKGSTEWRSTLWDIVGRIKWLGFGIFLLFAVSFSIFPGYLTEDMHSQKLKDWYPIILIFTCNVFDLVGKSLSALYLVENANAVVVACIARLLFYPLFLGCLHGPNFMHTEIFVTVLTCLLGLTNGYLTSVMMILTPNYVALQHVETAAIAMYLLSCLGMAAGSALSCFWVI